MSNKEPLNKKKTEAANKFQDTVYEYFAKEWGWNLIHHTSLENQFEKGENAQGIEIKHDQTFESGKSKNVYISVKRTYPYKEEVASGIMKEHNKRFFVIGGEYKFYIFALKDLRNYYLNNKPYLTGGFISKGGGQEWGFLLNEKQCAELAFEIFDTQLAII